jgi:hypothetical protein
LALPEIMGLDQSFLNSQEKDFDEASLIHTKKTLART